MACKKQNLPLGELADCKLDLELTIELFGFNPNLNYVHSRTQFHSLINSKSFTSFAVQYFLGLKECEQKNRTLTFPIESISFSKGLGFSWLRLGRGNREGIIYKLKVKSYKKDSCY